MDNNPNKSNDDIIKKIVKNVYNEIESSKILIFEFKSKFLNNNLDIIAIKKYLLYNLIDSFKQTLKIIEENIINMHKEINKIIKINKNIVDNKLYNDKDIKSVNYYRNPNPEFKYNYFKKYFKSVNLNTNNDINNDENDNNKKQNLNIINIINKKNNSFYRKEILANQINYTTNQNNYNYNNNINKNNNENNYIFRNPGKIMKKINSFNSEKIKNLNKNIYNEKINNTIRDEKNILNEKSNNINNTNNIIILIILIIILILINI